MSYQLKIGIRFRNGEKQRTYSLSNGKIPSFVGGLPLKTEEKDDLVDFLNMLEKADDLKYLTLFNFSENELTKVIKRIGDRLEELIIESLEPSSKIYDLKIINNCQKLRKLKINLYERKIRLWEVKRNKFLEELEIINCKKIFNQENFEKLTVKKLTIRRHSHGCSNIKGLIINDFNIFSTMLNLKDLTLLIGNKKEKVNDLLALSRLNQLNSIVIPKNYFFYNQFAWLTSKLPNVKGLGCYRIEYDHANEMDCYIINGSRMNWYIRGFETDKLQRYINKFDLLVEKYKNDDNPPIK